MFFSQIHPSMTCCRFKCLFAAITAAQGLFSSFLFGSTPVVLRSWKSFTFKWFFKEYLPNTCCSRLKIMNSDDHEYNNNGNNNGNNNDNDFTAAGL